MSRYLRECSSMNHMRCPAHPRTTMSLVLERGFDMNTNVGAVMAVVGMLVFLAFVTYVYPVLQVLGAK